MTLVYLACAVLGWLVGEWNAWEPAEPVHKAWPPSMLMPSEAFQSFGDINPYDNLFHDPHYLDSQAEGLRNMTPEERDAHNIAIGIWGESVSTWGGTRMAP